MKYFFFAACPSGIDFTGPLVTGVAPSPPGMQSEGNCIESYDLLALSGEQWKGSSTAKESYECFKEGRTVLKEYVSLNGHQR